MPQTEIETYMKELTDATAAIKARTPEPDEWKRINKAVTEAKASVDLLMQERASRVNEDGRTVIREGKFAGFDTLSLNILSTVVRSVPLDSRKAYHGILLAEADEARKKLSESMRSYAHIDRWADSARRAIRTLNGSVRGHELAMSNLEAQEISMRRTVNRALDSTTTAAGDELVPTFEASQLWMDVNLASTLVPLFRQLPMPTQPFDVPIQLGDLNFYPTVENVQGTTTDPATGKATLDAKGLKAGVVFSDELDEDSIVALVPALRSSMVRNAAEVLDDVLLNADQTAASGINSDGATIAASDAGKGQWLLGWDGLRHLPLVDNTAQASQANAAAAASQLITALRLLGKYAHGGVSDSVFIVPPELATQLMGETEVEVITNFGARATISTGELAMVYGRPLVVTGKFRLADTDGKVTDAGNSEETASILAVNTRMWTLGFRRGITLETQRDAGKSQTTLWVSLRPAFVAYGTRASAKHTSLVYDINGF